MALNLRRLLRPESIAVFGGREAAEVMKQCDRLGYDGRVYPVHPSKAEVHGRRCYRGIADLPEVPDVAFVGVNRELTVRIVAELSGAGSGGAVCYASGYKEVQVEQLQRALVDAAADMPILGPNCYGFINYLDGVALWPDQHGGRRIERRGVALLTQSGNMTINLTMQRRALPLAYIVTLGNQAQLGLSAMIDAVLDDDRVSAIGLHIEGVDDVGAFERAAQRAQERSIPIVAVKAGRSEIGAQLTMSHTASLSGSDQLVDAFLARLGIARVHSLTALLESLKLLHVFGPLPGNRIASMSCSGGEATLLADAAEKHNLCFPPLTEKQIKSVKASLSDLVTVSNPLDYHTFIWGHQDRLHATYSAMLDCGFDLSLLVLDYPRGDRCSTADWDGAVSAFVGAARVTGARTAILATLPENLPEATGDALLARSIAPLQGVDDAFTAIEAAAFIGARASSNAALPTTTRSMVQQASRNAITTDEWTAKQWLAEYGVACPPGHKVDHTEAVAAAEALGYPVVVKACSSELTHKTERQAVALNLLDAQSVKNAVESMLHVSDEFIVESMVVDHVAELIVGVNHDAQFGLYLVIASGGVLVELIGDAQILLLPTSRAEIVESLRTLRTWTLLSGYRGKPEGDFQSTVAAVEAIAQFALDRADRLLELDVNPLMVRPNGHGAIAADALVRYVPA